MQTMGVAVRRIRIPVGKVRGSDRVGEGCLVVFGKRRGRCVGKMREVCERVLEGRGKAREV